MARIGGKNTAPEILVRKLLHASGFRFRLHRKDLPGKPDILLPRFKTAIFVHGCFWHRHESCARSTTPQTRQEFWETKFQATVERDAKQQAALLAAGWRVIVVWECETRHKAKLLERLQHELQG